jgi:hypothetical protein
MGWRFTQDCGDLRQKGQSLVANDRVRCPTSAENANTLACGQPALVGIGGPCYLMAGSSVISLTGYPYPL